MIHNQSTTLNYDGHMDYDSIYNEFYFTHYGHNMDSDYSSLPYIRYVLHELSNYLNQIITFDSVLDVGCAMGFLVERMLDLHKDAVGIDVSSYALSHCVYEARHNLIQGDIVQIDLKDVKFDLITCIEVIEHIEPKYTERVIKKLANTTNKYVFFSSEENYDEPTHINVRPRREWVALWEKYGFKTIGCEFGYIPQGLLLKKVA